MNDLASNFQSIKMALSRNQHEDWRAILFASIFLLGCLYSFAIEWYLPPLWFSAIALICSVGVVWIGTKSLQSTALGLCAVFGSLFFSTLQEIRLPTISIEREVFVSVVGHVENLEHQPTGIVRLTLQIEEINKLAELKNQHIQLSVRTNVPENLIIGDLIAANAVLEPSAGPLVPGGFDFAQHNRFQGIAARGFAVSPIKLQDTENAKAGFAEKLANYRRSVSTEIMATLDQPVAGVAVALITGERQFLDRQTANVLRDAGLAHLLAISGLHMGLITGVAFFLLEFIFAATPGFALRWQPRKTAAVLAWITALSYLFISGAGISTIRAFVMVSVALMAVLTDRRVISLRSVAFAVVIILAISPQAVLSISFQMSFAATIGLVIFYDVVQGKLSNRKDLHGNSAWISKVGRYAMATALTSLVAQLAIAPIALYHFQALSIIGVVANVLAIPLMAFIVMPAAFLALLALPIGLGPILLALMGFGLEVVIGLSAFLVQAPFSVLRLGPFDASLLFLTLLGFMLAMLIRHWASLGAGLIAFAFGLLFLTRPTADVLIASEGRIIATKKPASDTMMIVGGRRGGFRDEVWQRYWNIPQSAVASRLERSCDSQGCMTMVPSLEREEERNKVLVIQRSYSLEAVRKACNAHQIVIAPYNFHRHCRNPAAFIAIEDISRAGPVALFLNEVGKEKPVQIEFSNPHRLLNTSRQRD